MSLKKIPEQISLRNFLVTPNEIKEMVKDAHSKHLYYKNMSLSSHSHFQIVTLKNKEKF